MLKMLLSLQCISTAATEILLYVKNFWNIFLRMNHYCWRYCLWTGNLLHQWQVLKLALVGKTNKHIRTKFSFHCVIYQDVLHSKTITLEHISKRAVSAVNFIHAQGQPSTVCFSLSQYWQWLWSSATLHWNSLSSMPQTMTFYDLASDIIFKKRKKKQHKNIKWQFSTFWNMQIISIASVKSMG
jgi:hypothetical protein